MFSRIYAPFRERFPDVTIQLRETSVHTQQDLIRSGQLDLGFLTLSEAQMTKDEYVSLWEEEILLAVPQKYPEALLQSAPPQPGSPYRVVPLERLQNEPFAMHERSFDPAPDPGGHLPPERPAAAGRL